MSSSLSEIYFHLVWTTWRRQPFVTEEIERDVYRSIEKEVKRLRCDVLAIGGMPDHVHLVVKTPTNVHSAKIAQQVKGVSSTFVRDQLRPGELFRWQAGFAAFSICRPHVKAVKAYVHNQKQHHGSGKLWRSLETCPEESDDEINEDENDTQEYL
jgi:putative transposase